MTAIIRTDICFRTLGILAVSLFLSLFSPRGFSADWPLILLQSFGESLAEISEERAKQQIIERRIERQLEAEAREQERQRALTSYHEIGHALIAHLAGRQIRRITRLGTDSWAGMTNMAAENFGDNCMREINKEITIAVAGHVAESIAMNRNNYNNYVNISFEATGSTADIDLAWRFFDNHRTQCSNITNDFQALVDRAVVRANRMLRDNIVILDKLSDQLLKKGAIYELDFATALAQYE